MAFSKQTIRDTNLDGKKVLVSVDYNVSGDETGAVSYDLRVKASLDTLRYLLAHNCALVLISHRGRPEGKVVPELSLQPVVPILQRLLGQTVHFANDSISDAAQSAKELLRPGEVLLLENTRFHPEEEANDDAFAAKLARHCDLYVQDAFGNAHRAHASTSAIAHHLHGFAGLLLEREVDVITEALEDPAHPFVAALGGAKIADKIDLIDTFLGKADTILIGGAMANTFFVAKKVAIGNSRYDKDGLDEARRIVDAGQKAVRLLLPDKDAVVAHSLDDSGSRRTIDLEEVGAEDMILDIGPESLKLFEESLRSAKTIFWNGTFGIAEEPAFARGSEEFARAVARTQAITIVGGGDTAGFIDQIGMVEQFTHVSTGGGASLELISGKKLPAVEALQDKA